ncbi:MAG TPA: prepilin-type N-terminal cleavage/methylation domain-containing protein [Desulfatiglandales bacterium]|nr:prepilin-type N-terminal cleavage/methylation domain-containing protein [Desulfatiglandales bacterium]
MGTRVVLRLRQNKGFSLVELTVVVFLLGMMLTISMPNLKHSLLTDDLKSISRKITGLVKNLRNEAIREQKTYTLHIDFEVNRLWVESVDMKEKEKTLAQAKAFKLPQGIRIMDVWRRGKGKNADGVIAIPFNKKGYTEQTLLHLSAEDGREFTLALSPFLGSIKSYDKYIDIETMPAP